MMNWNDMDCRGRCRMAGLIAGLVFFILVWIVAGFLNGLLAAIICIVIGAVIAPQIACSEPVQPFSKNAAPQGGRDSGAARKPDTGSAVDREAAIPAGETAAPALKPSAEGAGKADAGARDAGGRTPDTGSEVDREAAIPAGETAAPALKPSAEGAGKADAGGRTPDTGSEVDREAAIPAGETAGPAVRPTAALAGQADLAGRKGAWKYGASKGAVTEPTGGERTVEAGAGAAPKTIDAPRDGGKDDLKKIKGIGPKLEGVLNEMGYYHFDQVAAWSEAEVAWVDENVVGFKGRASRDDWVGQAKILASGGSTEFSERQGD